ncbi:structural maintenance of chromosomes protein, partial [Reticulomyxa filosa]
MEGKKKKEDDTNFEATARAMDLERTNNQTKSKKQDKRKPKKRTYSELSAENGLNSAIEAKEEVDDNNEKEEEFRNRRKKKSRTINDSDSSHNEEDNAPKIKEEADLPKPGTIRRVELINFLCHGNFSIDLRPHINIICGRNGSGKSAIEAAISMGLGASARKTGRGERLVEVIKDREEWCRIRLFINNSGSERFEKYGEEIIIQRELRKNSTGNATSTFAVLDGQQKKKASGLQAVKEITEALNIRVDNPCVILKQETAKQFLTSTKDNAKFGMFMQASELQEMEEKLNETDSKLEEANNEHDKICEESKHIQFQYEQAKKRMQQIENLKKYDEQVIELRRQLQWREWVEVQQETKKSENEYDKSVNDIKRVEDFIDKQSKQLETKRTEKDTVEKQMSQGTEFDQTVKAKHGDLEVLRQEKVKLDNESRECHGTKKSHETLMAQQQTTYQRLLKDIETEQARVNRNQQRGQLEQIEKEIQTCLQRLQTLRPQQQELETRVSSNRDLDVRQQEEQLRLLQRQNEVLQQNITR